MVREGRLIRGRERIAFILNREVADCFCKGVESTLGGLIEEWCVVRSSRVRGTEQKQYYPMYELMRCSS